MAVRVGVDVGGTNTDAAVIGGEGNAVLGSCKATTSEDVLSGVLTAIQGALASAKTDPSEVAAVMLGTTAFVNALVQRKGLAKAAVVRLCGPATRSLPPFVDMPPELRQAVGGCYVLASGGFEYDGSTELGPVDERELRQAARQILAAGIPCAVVSGVFSPVNAEQERRAAAVLGDEAARVAAERAGAVGMDMPAEGSMAAAHLSPPGQQPQQADEPLLRVCCSHEIGQLGLLERENAAVLNAALLPLAARVVPAVSAALSAAGLANARLFFCSNNATLLSAGDAMRLPVATFQSGPVNSLRGAALLSGVENAVVLDIGGTTTDVGVLVNGLPRPAPRCVRLAGAPTNFQMPDMSSIGLGGGSLLRFSLPGDTAAASPEDGGGRTIGSACSVGPHSVGARLGSEALCFGGATATATDAAVLLGRMAVDGASAEAVEAGGLSKEQAEAAWGRVQEMLEGCVDAAKTHAGDAPVIVVGGGASLCGAALRGASHLLRPAHAAVANAVGAAIAQVGGSVDAVHDMGEGGARRAAVLAAAQAEAEERAVAAGARPGSCWLAAREEVPLAYLPGHKCRVRVMVIAELDLGRLRAQAAAADAAQQLPEPAAAAAATAAAGPETAATARAAAAAEGPAVACQWPPLPGRGEEPSQAELAAWEPTIDPSTGHWLLAEPDLHLIAVGAGILGCGGGGSPGRALLKACMELQRLGPGCMRVISPASLGDGDLCCDAGFMGAPTVSIEKLDSDQAQAAVQAVLAAYRSTPPPAPGGGQASSSVTGAAAGMTGGGLASTANAKLAAVMAGEIGGGNGVEPLVVAVRLGLPCLDGDLMGRAFPELQMMTSTIYGMPVLPAAVADERGNCVVVQQAANADWLEKLLRPVCTEMGCSAGFSACPLTGAQLKKVVVPHSLSLAWRLGKAVAQARSAKQDPAAAVAAAGGGQLLFTGKVVDVRRQTSGGFARGQLRLHGSGGSLGRAMRIEFQNENLVAYEEAAGGQEAEQLAGQEAGGAQQAGGGGTAGAGAVMASVPDLICCLETETGLPIATEEMRYGLRASVVALPAHPLLRTERALQVVGPAAFGHAEVAYTPLASYPEQSGIPR